MKRTGFKKPTTKICPAKGCRVRIPLNEYYCSDACGTAYARQLIEESRKTNQRLFKEFKSKVEEKHMTLGKWIKLAQPVFNEYIRLRDRDLPCISCGTTKPVKYDAGHFYGRKAYPNLRFDEDNVHKQCSKNCNVELGGNLLLYRTGLIAKIGMEAFEALEARKNIDRKYTIPEIKELIEVYRKKIRELKKCVN